MIEWTTIITALIAALLPSGLIGFFTIREQRNAAKLANKEKETDIREKEDNRWSKLCDELQDQIENLNTRLAQKDERIIELEDSNALLRQRLDETNTALAKANLLKCSKLACISRIPPLGYSELTPEEITRFNEENTES